MKKILMCLLCLGMIVGCSNQANNKNDTNNSTEEYTYEQAQQDAQEYANRVIEYDGVNNCRVDSVQKGESDNTYDVELMLITQDINGLEIELTLENKVPKSTSVTLRADNDILDEINMLGSFLVYSYYDDFFREDGATIADFGEESADKVDDYLNYILQSDDQTDDLNLTVGDTLIYMYTVGDDTVLNMHF